MPDLVLAVLFMWIFQFVCTGVLLIAHAKTHRNINLRTEILFPLSDRTERILNVLKDMQGSDLNLLGDPYRSPADVKALPISTKIQEPPFVPADDWKPGEPCPFCLTDVLPESAKVAPALEGQYAPEPQGMAADGEYLLWYCRYCQAAWQTGVHKQDRKQLHPIHASYLSDNRKVREIDVSGMAPDDVLKLVQGIRSGDVVVVKKQKAG